MKDAKFLNELMSRLLNGSIPDICNDATENTIVTASGVAAETIFSVIEMMGLESKVHMEKQLHDGIATWHLTFPLGEDAREHDYKVTFLSGDCEAETKYFDTVESACHAAICWDCDTPVNGLYVMRKDKVTGQYFHLLFLGEDSTYEIEANQNDIDYPAIQAALVEGEYIR